MSDQPAHHPKKSGFLPIILLSYGALGVVYGDIGTSPLYALNETFFGHHALVRNETNVHGILSLFFWSLTLVVTLKYLMLILKADNQGEGGVFSELSLIKSTNSKSKLSAFVISALVFGACLLYADGLITPAISVLSAVEGIEIATPAFHNAILPITIVILILLFSVQRKGTGAISNLFGFIMLIWFGTLSAVALPFIIKHPEVFTSLDPRLGFDFLIHHGFDSMWVLGSVVLCITGGEALYADMGHFGRIPIRLAWFFIVYPALILNYFGQGARLLEPGIIPSNNLFYAIVPEWGLIPMVILATAATIIASQALISGAYSLTQQAVGLGYFPRMKIVHTSASILGQIYMPAVNWLLMVGCITLVIFFKSSSNLAAAYGLTVTATMAITTLGFYLVATEKWKWNKFLTGGICIFLGTIDLAFFASNTLKFLDGGFIPLLIALMIYGVMQLWNWGRNKLGQIYAPVDLTLGDLFDLKNVEWKGRIPTKISFFSPSPVVSLESKISLTAQTFITRYHMLPAGLTFITVRILNEPFLEGNRIERYEFGENTNSIVISYGYMEEIDLLEALHDEGINGNILVGDHEIFSDDSSWWHNFKTRVFRNMLRLSLPTYRYFGMKGQVKIIKEILPVEFGKDKSILLDVE